MTTDPNLRASSSAESTDMANPNFTDLDQFALMKHRKRSVEKISVYIGIPLVGAMVLYNFMRGNTFVAFLNGAIIFTPFSLDCLMRWLG